MAEPCVVDTMVLRKANAPLTKAPKEQRDFRKRLALLKQIRAGDLEVLISAKLLLEYKLQILQPRNDFVQEFMAVVLHALTQSDVSMEKGKIKVKVNWPYWPGRRNEEQNHCRFPNEDTHVLRTAFCDGERSTIYSEEERMLKTDACVYQHFRVHVVDPRYI